MNLNSPQIKFVHLPALTTEVYILMFKKYIALENKFEHTAMHAKNIDIKHIVNSPYLVKAKRCIHLICVLKQNAIRKCIAR